MAGVGSRCENLDAVTENYKTWRVIVNETVARKTTKLLNQLPEQIVTERDNTLIQPEEWR